MQLPSLHVRPKFRSIAKLVQVLLLVVTVTFVLPSFADLVSGAGAGSLPSTALDLTGHHGGLTIQGSLPYDINGNLLLDAAVFAIDITDFHAFSAATVSVTGADSAYGIPDTELFLFNASGLGIYMNDDVSGSDTLSFLPPPSFGLGPLSDGLFYLAIARSADLPVDASLNELFSPGSSTDVVGGNLGVGPIAGWDGGTFASPDTDLIHYQIQLTGVPEPTSLVLISPGLVVGWLARKRLLRK